MGSQLLQGLVPRTHGGDVHSGLKEQTKEAGRDRSAWASRAERIGPASSAGLWSSVRTSPGHSVGRVTSSPRPQPLPLGEGKTAVTGLEPGAQKQTGRTCQGDSCQGQTGMEKASPALCLVVWAWQGVHVFMPQCLHL